MVQINPTIARHIKHATYLKSSPTVFSIPCPRRTAWLQQSAIWTTRHKRNHFQPTRDKRIIWTKSTGLLVRWPRMRPLPRHAFSNPINWRLHNISPVQAVPHPCPNTQGTPTDRAVKIAGSLKNRHPKYRKRNPKNERETRHENREPAKKLNEKRKAGSTTASTTPKRVPIVEEPIF